MTVDRSPFSDALERIRALVVLCRCLGGTLRRGGSLGAEKWEAVVDLADEHGVAPALWEALGTGVSLPDRLARRLGERYATNAVVNAHLRTQLLDVLGALNTAGVEPIVLKGGFELLRSSNLVPPRTMSDLDLLVSPSELWVVLRTLRDLGYEWSPPRGRVGSYESTLSRSDAIATIDLHHALGPPEFEAFMPSNSAIERAVSHKTDEGPRYQALEPPDQLAYSVVCVQLRDWDNLRAQISVRQLHNFVTVFVRHTNAWESAVERLVSDRFTREVVQAHAALVRYLFGTDLPIPFSSTRARLHVAYSLGTAGFPFLSTLRSNVLWMLRSPVTRLYPHPRPLAFRVRRKLASRWSSQMGRSRSPELGREVPMQTTHRANR